MVAVNNYSNELSTLRIKPLLWAASLGLTVTGVACIAATVSAKTPIQKFAAGLIGSGAFSLSLAWVRPEYHRSNQRTLHLENAMMEGDRAFQLQRFQPPQPQQLLPAEMEAEVIENPYNLVDHPIADRLLLALAAVGITTKEGESSELVDIEEYEEFDRYIVALPTGFTVGRVSKLAADIMSKGGFDVEPVISAVPGGCAIDFPKEIKSIEPTATDIVDALLKTAGKKLKFTEKQEGLAFDRYLFIPDKGVKVSDIQAKSKDLMVNAGLSKEPMISAVSGAIAIDVAKDQRIFAKYADYIKPGEKRPGFQVPEGVDHLTGEVVFMDFANPDTPHKCVAGTTGSGKSEDVKIDIHYISDTQEPGSYHIIAIDVKASTFSEFEGKKGVTVIENPVHGAIAIVKSVAKMVNRREIRKGFKDVDSYNKQAEKKIPRLLIYVEELKDMLDGLKTLTPNELEQVSDAVSEAFGSEIKVGYARGEIKPSDLVLMALGRVGQAGRSENVNLVLITQEPDKKLLDSLIGNLPAKIALRLNSHIESNVILPGKNAHCEQLLGKGDLFYSVPGQPLRRLQSLYLG